ncbi:MAG: MarR family winged helix-turn-helix transcriptional regulator [Gammaproteobacteria bacterium]
MSKSKKLSQSDLKTFTRSLLQCGDQLHTLCRLEVNNRLSKYDVKYSQWLILDCLSQEEVDNPSKVASQLGMERATVSRSLDILESRNLVSRTHNLADRRVVEIQVTAQGRKIAQMGVQRLEQIVQSVTADHSGSKVNELFSLLDQIKENLNQKIAR